MMLKNPCLATMTTINPAHGLPSSSSIQPLFSLNNAFPHNWFLKEYQSHPGHYYYFNHDSGECVWELPSENNDQREYDASISVAEAASRHEEHAAVTQESLNATAAAAAAAVKSILKRSSIPTVVVDSSAADAKDEHDEEDDENTNRDDDGSSPPRKKMKSDKKHHHHHRKPTSEEPKEVRVLHILKKHAGSRRPSSWRVKEITISKSKAVEELRELLAILQEVREGSGTELRATFEELARTESDCSSAKRGGDLGFFGKKKMQPAFEKASFGLKVGQLSEIVDTSSGVHIILRLA
ncbi:hypothetical protein ACHAWX_000547 [Stephanocyclus meneghinianus]